ncbi:MAG: hypothetical protein MJ106_06955 [Lentisphaeria bacterium]|nr:hypothetical protein [Lentisphaeria bacterium]
MARAELPTDVEMLRQELTEAREVAAMRGEENERLAAEKAVLEKELAEMRSRYASLLLETDQLVKKSMEVDLEAAALVRGDDKKDDGIVEAGKMLEILGFCRKKISEFASALNGHRETMNAIMDAIQASEATREQASKSLLALEKKLDECLEILELSTNQGMFANSESCAVLRLDTATQIAIIDQGSLHGIRQGQNLVMERENVSVATLKTVIVRPRYSAAILTEGDFNALACGALLHKK